MLTGELPLGRFDPPSRRAKVDVQLDKVVLRALEKEPERRYQSAADVKTAVENCRDGTAPPRAAKAESAWVEDTSQLIFSVGLSRSRLAPGPVVRPDGPDESFEGRFHDRRVEGSNPGRTRASSPFIPRRSPCVPSSPIRAEPARC